MVTITRSLIRQLRSNFRRAGISKSSGVFKNSILFRSGADGLRVQFMSDLVAIEYRQSGQFDTDEFFVEADSLWAAEGRTAETVTLETQDRGKILASWNDGGIPQTFEAQAGNQKATADKFPLLPESLVSNPPELRTALEHAITIVCRDSSRYALDCLQLRADGKIVSTDGRHALIQGGFQFPCNDAVLVPASPVFACRELPHDEAPRVGVIGDWFAFTFGAWTVWLKIQRGARFPRVDDIVAKPLAACSHLVIEPADGQFLETALERLPCDDTTNYPITLDLNGQVVVRGRPAGQTRSTELVLSRSRLEGENIVVSSNREYLARAIKLGFRDVYLFGPRSPLLCDDGRRQYFWMPLEPDDAIRGRDDVVRIDSASHAAHEQPSSSKQHRRRFNVVQPTSSSAAVPSTHNGHTGPANSANAAGPVSQTGNTSATMQAIALRAVLREALAQNNELIRALKREKRQSRLVASTLASLKQLQAVAG